MSIQAHALHRLDAGEHLNGAVQISVHRRFVVTVMRVALGEDGVRHTRGGNEIGVTHFIQSVWNTQQLSDASPGLHDEQINLLAVIGRMMAQAWLEALTVGRLGTLLEGLCQAEGFLIPLAASLFGDLCLSVLVDDGAFQADERGIDLTDHIAIAFQVEAGQLNFFLAELWVIVFVHLVRALKKFINLSDVIAPLTLSCSIESRRLFFALLTGHQRPPHSYSENRLRHLKDSRTVKRNF